MLGAEIDYCWVGDCIHLGAAQGWRYQTPTAAASVEDVASGKLNVSAVKVEFLIMVWWVMFNPKTDNHPIVELSDCAMALSKLVT